MARVSAWPSAHLVRVLSETGVARTALARGSNVGSWGVRSSDRTGHPVMVSMVSESIHWAAVGVAMTLTCQPSLISVLQRCSVVRAPLQPDTIRNSMFPGSGLKLGIGQDDVVFGPFARAVDSLAVAEGVAVGVEPEVFF